MRALAYYDISGLTPDDLASIATDEDMHVRLDPNGPWHRQATHRYETVTACGETLPPVRAMGWAATIRKATYENPLCPICFTRFERDEAERLEESESRLSSIPDSSNTNTGDNNG